MCGFIPKSCRNRGGGKDKEDEEDEEGMVQY